MIVPQFHAMAWGMPYAAWWCGADIVMPQQFLQGAAIADVVERSPSDDLRRRAHGAERRAPQPSRRRSLVAALHHLRWVGGAAVADRGLSPHLWCRRDPGLGHDRDVAAGGAGLAAREERHPRMRSTGAEDGSRRAGVEVRIAGDDGTVLPWDGESQGEIEIAGPVDHGQLLRRRRRPRSSTTAGCAPAMSARSSRTASSRSPTGPRT